MAETAGVAKNSTFFLAVSALLASSSALFLIAAVAIWAARIAGADWAPRVGGVGGCCDGVSSPSASANGASGVVGGPTSP